LSDSSTKDLPAWNYNVEAGLANEIGANSTASYQGIALARIIRESEEI